MSIQSGSDDESVEGIQSESESEYPFMMHGSLRLAGVVQECVGLCRARIQYLENKFGNVSNSCHTLREGGFDSQASSGINEEHDSKIDFSNLSVQLHLLLLKWEELMFRAATEPLDFGLKVLSFSVNVIKFLSRVRAELFEYLESIEDKGGKVDGLSFCFLSAHHLELMTQLFCRVIHLSRSRKTEKNALAILLNIFADALETLLQGAAENVMLEVSVIQDWIFLLCIPWVKRLGQFIPECTAVKELNSLTESEIPCDTLLQRSCVMLFRFEVFFPFRDTIRKVLWDVMTLQKPNSTCFSVLKIISGAWWPVQLFRWRHLSRYCCYLFSQKIWERSEEVAVALAEAFVRLPCVYAEVCNVKKESSTEDSDLAVPKVRGCEFCERSGDFRSDLKRNSKKRKFKMKPVEVHQMKAMFLQMLKLRKTRVHLVLINLLISFRSHSRLRIITLADLFLKIYASSPLVVRTKLADMYGFCVRQTKMVRRRRQKLSFNRFLKPSTKFAVTSAESSRKMDCDGLATTARNQSAKSRISRRSGRTKSQCKQVRKEVPAPLTKPEFKEPPSRSSRSSSKSRNVAVEIIRPYLSQKQILVNSKASFTVTAPLGRFDAAEIMYHGLLREFFVSCDIDSQKGVHRWNVMVDLHLILYNLSRHADGEVLMIEIIKCYLNMLARLEMINLIILCRRTLVQMAARAGCMPWELCGRYRDTVAEEIRKICFDHFFSGSNPKRNDAEAIKLCTEYLLKVRIVLDSIAPNVLMNTWLRIVTKRCVLTMFQDNKAFNLVVAIGKFTGYNSTAEFLEVEFAHAYPYAVLHASQSEVRDLEQNLKKSYRFDPVALLTNNAQFLHIETLSYIFEHKDAVIQSYSLLLRLDERDSCKISRQVKAISRALERYYMGVFLFFESRFSSRAECIISKRRYLGCFTSLMGLLGKRKVTSSRLKLYSLLNSMRKMGKEFHDLLYQAWRAYTTNLEEDSLRYMANQILAGIEYLRGTKNAEVDGLCNWILTSVGGASINNVKHLHFLTDVSEDEVVKSKIEDAIIHIKSSNSSGFFYQLIEELGHENSHVRYRALVSLEKMLKANSGDLPDLQFENQLFSHETTLLLRNLLNATKNGICEKTEELSASCIGMIGALDPGRFDLKVQLSDNARFGLTIFTVGEVDFLKFIIEELTRTLRGSVDTQNFDSCAFCIQEVIKLYRIQQSSDDPVWSRLSARAQDLMAPLFSSKYSRSNNNASAPQLPSPVYMTEHGRSLSKWLYNWSLKMTSVISSQELQKFFEVVVSTVDKSEHMGLVIIPYVVSYAIIEGFAEGVSLFLEEINAVLRHWAGDEDVYYRGVTDRQLRLDDDSESVESVLNSVQTPVEEEDRKLDQWRESPSLNPATQDDEVCTKFPYAAAQAVFKVLDHLQRLVRNPKHQPRRRVDVGPESQSQIAEKIAAARSLTLEDSRPIVNAQDELRYEALSQAAFQCRNYSRALMYMEQYLQRFPSDIEFVFEDLQRIYVALSDNDSVKGLETKRRKEITIMEDALNKLSQGKLETCIPLFETELAEDPEDLVSHQQLVQAYLGLDKFYVSDLLIQGCCSQRPAWSRSFDEAKLEICIKKGDYSGLRKRIEELSCDKLSSWGLSVSEAFLHLNQGNFSVSKEKVRNSKLNLIKDMCDGAALLDMGFYFRHYHDFMRLQLVTELEEMQNIIAKKLTTDPTVRVQNFLSLKSNWDRRLKCMYNSMENLQTIISFRKTLLTIAKRTFMDDFRMVRVLNKGLRDCFVKLAKMESSLGNYSRAEQLFTECKLITCANVFYEEGKMLFQAGRYKESMQVLQVGMDSIDSQLVKEYKSSSPAAVLTEEQIRFAKAFLLYTIQADEQRKVDLHLNVNNYQFAIELNKQSEKSYFYMALFYDRLWSQAEERDKQTSAQILMVKNYGLSLACGCNYIYQSLPRMLTIWFDYAAQSRTSSTPPADSAVVLQLTESIRELRKNAPTYIFIVAFSVLISRLAHANQVVYTELKEVIAHMIAVHSEQVLWLLVSVLKSTYPKRVQRCMEILSLAEKKKPQLRNTIRSYRALGDKLIQFTMRKTENTRFAKVSELLPALPKLIRSKEFSNVLVPFQVFMRPALPRGGKYIDSHRPFPEQLVYIQDILEPVQVMASLQKPKKITLVGSDGKSYPVMCKPSDDLRKDGKVMEINSMVQWYMHRDKESRKRNLIVRTYNVAPLCDTCGILEWIPNLHGYRPLITSLYKDGVGFAPGQQRPTARAPFCDRKDPMTKKRQAFVDNFVRTHPIVMSYWFLKAFHDPQSWYMARTSYVKTSAVMSIIGFLMGLGDRHGENILLDSSNGDVVHVDFNCLFNKGETFDWPERVPFRLTRNMIDGMGPLGYEGTFRCCCEIVMRLIRNHSSVFLSIIRPFVFDPLLEWEYHVQLHAKSAQEGECNNQKAVEHLNNIRDRLLGSARNMTKERNVALSVEAHVNYLIKESTKIENLCQMYIGWAGYL